MILMAPSASSVRLSNWPERFMASLLSFFKRLPTPAIIMADTGMMMKAKSVSCGDIHSRIRM